MSSPKISIVLPLFNGQKYLGEAIQSVYNQSFQDFELIIVDNGSRDSYKSIIDKFPSKTRLIHEEKRGVAAARNKGIKMAKGDYIAFLDQDDLYLEASLEKLYSAIQDTPLDAVTGKTQYLFETPATRKRWPQIKEDGIVYSKLFGACLFNKRIFDKQGFLLEKPELSDDVEWFYRLDRNQVEIAKADHVTLIYRQHDENTSSSQDYTNRVLLKVIKYTLDQRRNSS